MKKFLCVIFLILLVLFTVACAPLEEHSIIEPDSTLEENVEKEVDIPVQEEQKTQETPVIADDTTIPLIVAYVTAAIDGDTINVRFEDGSIERVRLIGVDTPESTRTVEPFGKEAFTFTDNELTERRVYLEFDVTERDRFGRILAYVWLTVPQSDSKEQISESMFNAHLLQKGFGNIMTVPPNVKYAKEFIEFEREAREANAGLWGLIAAEQPKKVIIDHVDLRVESVTIKNNSTDSVDLAGWTLLSERGEQSFLFPDNTVLPPGGYVTVVSGPDAIAADGVLIWTDKNIWNNDGDPAVLFNTQGIEVSRK